MRFRKYRHRITIQAEQNEPDGQGGRETVWSDLFTTWASIKTKTGTEKEEGQQTQPTVNYEIEMRYRPGITSKNRVVFQGRVFDIKNVNNVKELNKTLILTCVEKVGRE
jgi:SPP1 family predicted phage head-tail adaptor